MRNAKLILCSRGATPGASSSLSSMCGICGKLNFDGRPVRLREVEAMAAVLRHRGPDELGAWADGPAGLATARLAVIDLETGRQPIPNEDHTVWASANCEIYNFVELRRELTARGHRFRTGSDVETVVHLYEEYGEGLAGKLDGMFAIALWDLRRRRLVLIRDRLGVKPLYYYLGPDRLVFGSELKALLADDIPREVDPQAVDDYLTHGYVPGSESIFRNVYKLPAAHTLVCGVEGNLALREYWRALDPSRDAEHAAARDPRRRAEALWSLVRDAVRRRLHSDVPLGVLLSGGVDSAAVTAALSEVAPREVSAFTIGFEEKSYDETRLARLIAERFRIDHHVLIARPDEHFLFDKYVEHFDEPFGEASAVPIYYVAQLARQKITVAVGGDGADELLGGYNHYAANRYMALYRKLPPLLKRRLIPWTVDRLPVSHDRFSFADRAARFVSAVDLSAEQAHLRWLEIMSEEEKRGIRGEALRERPDKLSAFRFVAERFAEAAPLEGINRLMYVDTKLYLVDSILTKLDRMTMAHGLEARSPFLDYRLVEFCLRLPPEEKIRGFERKRLLKRALASRLPRETLSQRKMGFVPPVAQWFCGPLKGPLRDALAPQTLKRDGYFDPAAVERLLEEHLARRADHGKALFGILAFTLWLKRWGRRPAANGS